MVQWLELAKSLGGIPSKNNKTFDVTGLLEKKAESEKEQKDQHWVRNSFVLAFSILFAEKFDIEEI